MLEGAEGVNSTSSTKMAKHRGRMLKELKDLVNNAHCPGVSINEQTLSSASALWKGLPVPLNSSNEMSPQVLREVIWELYEARFRLELITLDRLLVPEPQGASYEVLLQKESWLERSVLVEQCWPGLACQPQYENPGFSSEQPYTTRGPFIKAFFDLIQHWPGDKPAELKGRYPMDFLTESTYQLMRIEEALAHYYVRMFLKVYHRPPTIPHVALVRGMEMAQ